MVVFLIRYFLQKEHQFDTVEMPIICTSFFVVFYLLIDSFLIFSFLQTIKQESLMNFQDNEEMCPPKVNDC